MINFTVGPVQSEPFVREIGAEQVPYFRTPEFSEVMLESEQLILALAHAEEGARCVFITGSGTASMEAVVMNTLTQEDKAIVIDGGSFGHRFVEMLDLHKIPHEVIKMQTGQQITEDMLLPFDGKGFTAFLVNVDETSTGILYDADLISRFCKKNGIFLIVDAISSFLADEFHMKELGADVMITGSQKALACPPGISLIILSRRALERVEKIPTKCMYLDLKSHLKNMERGQTPFTPAVATLLQIHARVKNITENGGAEGEIRRTKERAEYFRGRISNLPFEIVAENCSNAVTALWVKKENASEICQVLKDEYQIWVCPNGGEMKDKIFRVGHIGDLSFEEYDKLIDAMKEMQDRGIL
ncbi:MAG: alanine--glyoxylate aminotransferase family protein [Parasporobacterium sp.]|nr:alanine--glyoxylate aminotransferase family protein [Parasporobacterium sp.]